MIDSFYGSIIKLIITLSTGVLGIIPGIDGNEAFFTETDFYIRGNQILISSQIENPFNKRIDDIIKTGRSVRIKIVFECFQENIEKSIAESKIIKTINFNILENYYEVSYKESGLVQNFYNSEKMWENFLKIENQPVFQAKLFSSKINYFIKIKAYLETELQIGGKNVDIMLFWNNIVPEYKTENFDKSIFTY